MKIKPVPIFLHLAKKNNILKKYGRIWKIFNSPNALFDH